MNIPCLRCAVLCLAAVWCVVLPAAAQEAAPSPAPPPPEPVRVMILGVYHMANPGLDLHNMKVDNMLSPQRQEELADLANCLARFAPTKVAVESTPKEADLSDAGYKKFNPDILGKNPDETVQVAYRLAHQLGHQTVYGIDEQSETVDYFPFDKVEEYAKTHGRADVLATVHAGAEKNVAEAETAQKTLPVRLTLAMFNEPAHVARDQEFYYSVLQLADRRDQPGATLNAMWYMRNAKIFAKLLQVAKPGDRVVVVFGAGHNFWLRHFVEHTPGCVLEDPLPYLK